MGLTWAPTPEPWPLNPGTWNPKLQLPEDDQEVLSTVLGLRDTLDVGNVGIKLQQVDDTWMTSHMLSHPNFLL